MNVSIASGHVTHQAQAVATAKRRYELDWLRTLVVLGLIPVHTAPIFTPSTDLYLKDTHTSAAMLLVGTFVGVFGMPLLFFVSGAATWFALRSRTPARYVRERVLRLLVPLLFATLTIVPVQAYVVARSNPDLLSSIGAPIYDPHFLDSFVKFYPQYLVSYVYFLGHPSIPGFIAFIGQLWFVVYLFVFSLLALPLFMYLRRPESLRQIERLAGFCARPGAIFLLALPLALADALAHAIWTGTGAVAEIFVYLLSFIFGYALYADPRFEQAIRRQWGLALAAGLGLWIFAELFLLQGPQRPYDNNMGSIFFIPLRGIMAWFWVIGWIGFGMTYLSHASRLLGYLSNAAYPVFILHVAVIVSVGSIVIGWDIPLLAKFAIIMVAAYAIVLGIYEVLIRRFNFMRVLFGLRAAPTQRPSPPAPISGQAT